MTSVDTVARSADECGAAASGTISLVSIVLSSLPTNATPNSLLNPPSMLDNSMIYAGSSSFRTPYTHQSIGHLPYPPDTKHNPSLSQIPPHKLNPLLLPKVPQILQTLLTQIQILHIRRILRRRLTNSTRDNHRVGLKHNPIVDDLVYSQRDKVVVIVYRAFICAVPV